MKLKQLRIILVFLSTFLIIVGPFTRPAQAELSIEEEKKMGQQFMIAALSHLPLIEDPEVVAYMNRVGQQVVSHLEVHTFNFNFYVVDSDQLNAFAAPAGYVFINRGLVEIMDDEGELAAILAHEIAHVQSRHISQRMDRAKKLNLASIGAVLASIFIGAAGGGEAGSAILVGGMAGSQSMQLQYSRMDEEEADRKGLLYLEAAGYQGQDFVTVMRKMGQDSWKAGGRIPGYLSTHPGVPERVNYLASVVETRPNSPRRTRIRVEDSVAFKMVQAKLFGAYTKNLEEAEVNLRAWLAKPETRVMAHYGLGIVHRRQKRFKQSVESFKTAISERPDLPPILIELGETYFQMGELDKSISVLQSALTLDPNHPYALYVLGRCLLEQGKPMEAITHLEKAAQIYPRLPADINYYLGMAYYRVNQLGQSHYQTGLYNLRKGSLRTARFHFQEALRHTENPELEEKIRSYLEKLDKKIRAEQQAQNRGR